MAGIIQRSNVQLLNSDQRGSRAVSGMLVDAMINLHPGGLTWRRVYPGTLDQVPHARHLAGLLLADSPCREDAELIITELAANAVLHASSSRRAGTFIVEITRTSQEIGLAVYDCGWGHRPPLRKPCAADAEHGRGLIVVETLADTMGYEGDDEIGHKVWATLRTSRT
ncbi:ATP-binding protein [Nonomuraea sp. PA05]|uniref:ATP-binding protein n=1 Tax=Nonomuraea sp. PA05 TaxID=2604466 RepID=UPI0011D53CCF|nr:ATP-binding protein [Nonomuraea sp. PA05]TYB67752.1 ATP-binding protein [Nonomuraea sp. PA05]